MSPIFRPKPTTTPPINPGEAEHITRSQQGDKAAYRYLVEGYQDKLFGLVMSLVHNTEQAEDLTQEIFVKAYFALPSFEGQSAFYTWLYRIASNHCLDHLRKHRPVQVSLDKPLLEESDMTLEDTLEAPASDRPDAPLETHSEAAALLQTLNPDERLILSLRELEGHSYEELAEMLQCPMNTVKSRLNRAREALKAAYEKLYGPARRSPSEGGNISESKIVLESREKP